MVNYRRTISAAHLVGNEYWTDSAMRRVITYGTFDLLHYGHIRLLQRCKEQGDYLVVALSSDEFNAGKGKKSYFSMKNASTCSKRSATSISSFLRTTGNRRRPTSRNFISTPSSWATTGKANSTSSRTSAMSSTCLARRRSRRHG